MNLDKKTIKTILVIITFAILLYVATANVDVVFSSVIWIFDIILPFLLGAAIAFVLNVPMRFLERKLPEPKNRFARKARRPLMVLAVLLFVTVIVAVVMLLVIPQLTITLVSLATALIDLLPQLERWVASVIEWLPPELEAWIFELDLNWSGIVASVADMFTSWSTALVDGTVSIVGNLVSVLVNFVLGLIFAIYILMQKEQLSKQVRRLFYAFLPRAFADRFFYIAGMSNRVFSGFLSGQCTEAVVISVLFFVTMSIFRFPHALMISVLTGFTALIPIFGAFIGCAIGALLILVQSPMQALWFVIMFLIVQQIEGNLIYPLVVGNSIGLPSLWVLTAVVVGGNMFGIIGILLFIPLTSVVYALVGEAVEKRARQGRVPTPKQITDPPPTPKKK